MRMMALAVLALSLAGCDPSPEPAADPAPAPAPDACPDNHPCLDQVS